MEDTYPVRQMHAAVCLTDTLFGMRLLPRGRISSRCGVDSDLLPIGRSGGRTGLLYQHGNREALKCASDRYVFALRNKLAGYRVSPLS